MKTYSKEFCIEKMAKILGVCRAGYYQSLKRSWSKKELENQELIKDLKEVYEKNRGVYGSPRIHQELLKKGRKCSRRRVSRLMKQEGICSKIRKKWKKTTQKDPKAKAAPNYVEQNFLVEKPNKVWVSDITYVATKDGWLYVGVVLDLFSRKVIGLSMGESLETSLVVKALNQALCHRNLDGELIHHSDRGCQYTSKEFRELAKRNGIKLSMSGKGHCYDNAVAESFFHTLKTEHVYLEGLKEREAAKRGIFDYVEVFYNRKRLHSTLEYVAPVEYEKSWHDKRRNIA